MENDSSINPLDAIFAPKSVAVIGASTTPGKVGHDIFVNILKGGYTGTLYPVNPSARSIASVRAYKSLTEIPDEIDLGIVILPPKAALQSVQEAVAKGVKGIVIVSAGFREIGPEGRAIEDRLVATCREAGVRREPGRIACQRAHLVAAREQPLLHETAGAAGCAEECDHHRGAPCVMPTCGGSVRAVPSRARASSRSFPRRRACAPVRRYPRH